MATNQIKLFRATDILALEHKVNEWLRAEGEAIHVVDMQMSTSEIARPPRWSAPVQAVVVMVSYTGRE